MLVIVSDTHGAVDRLEKLLDTCSRNGWPMAHAGDGVVDGIVDIMERAFDAVKSSDLKTVARGYKHFQDQANTLVGSGITSLEDLRLRW